MALACWTRTAKKGTLNGSRFFPSRLNRTRKIHYLVHRRGFCVMARLTESKRNSCLYNRIDIILYIYIYISVSSLILTPQNSRTLSLSLSIAVLVIPIVMWSRDIAIATFHRRSAVLSLSRLYLSWIFWHSSRTLERQTTFAVVANDTIPFLEW